MVDLTWLYKQTIFFYTPWPVPQPRQQIENKRIGRKSTEGVVEIEMPLPKQNDSYGEGRLPVKASLWSLQNFDCMQAKLKSGGTGEVIAYQKAQYWMHPDNTV